MIHLHQSEFQELIGFYERTLKERAALEEAARGIIPWRSRVEAREMLSSLDVYLRWLKEVMEQENLIQ